MPDEDGAKRYGPTTLSSTDADDGCRLYLSQTVLEDSGIDPEGAVLLQPYENEIHVIDAAEAIFDE